MENRGTFGRQDRSKNNVFVSLFSSLLCRRNLCPFANPFLAGLLQIFLSLALRRSSSFSQSLADFSQQFGPSSYHLSSSLCPGSQLFGYSAFILSIFLFCFIFIVQKYGLLLQIRISVNSDSIIWLSYFTTSNEFFT